MGSEMCIRDRGTEGAKGIEKEQMEERGNGRERRKLREGMILRLSLIHI